MAHFLFCPWSALGDLYPTIPVAQALENRGHNVAYYVSPDLAPVLATQGTATFVATVPTKGHVDEEHWLSAGQQASYELVHFLIDPAPQQVTDLKTILRSFPADVIVDGVIPFGPRLVSELLNIPHASICQMACPLPSRDLAPYGSGLSPPRDAIGRSLARLAYAREQERAQDVSELWDAARAEIGLRPAAENPWRAIPSHYLVLLPTTPAFEYPRSDLPSWAHFIGPLLWYGPSMPTPTSIASLAHRHPIIFVSQGTVFNDDLSLIRLALDAFADESVTVVVAVGRPFDPHELDPVPMNAVVEQYVPYTTLLDKVDLVVTHGASGTVHAALSHAIPMVVVPLAADQPENAQRCVEAGVGVRLDIGTCSPPLLRRTAMDVLNNSWYKANARRIGESYAQHDAPFEAAVLLERLATTRQPVSALESLGVS